MPRRWSPRGGASARRGRLGVGRVGSVVVGLRPARSAAVVSVVRDAATRCVCRFVVAAAAARLRAAGVLGRRGRCARRCAVFAASPRALAAFDDAAREAAVRFDAPSPRARRAWRASGVGAAPVAVAAAFAAVLRGARGLRAGLAAVAASDASDSPRGGLRRAARLRRRGRGAGRLRGRGLRGPRPRRTRLRCGLRRSPRHPRKCSMRPRQRCSRGASRSPAARAARSTTPDRRTPPCRCLRELRRLSLSAKRKSPRQPTNHDPPNPVATSPEDVEAVHSLSVASRSHYDPLPCVGVATGAPDIL